MKVNKLFQIVPWLIVAFLLWFKGCDKGQTEAAIVPEVKGFFQETKPAHEPVPVAEPKIVERWNETHTENPINQALIDENLKLKADFAKADSISKSKMYDKAVQLNEFRHEFDNDYLHLTLTGFVQGEIKSIIPAYTLKERKAEEKAKNHVYISGALENTATLDNATMKVGIMFQNKSGDIISGSYGTDRSIGIGYAKRIW